MQARVITTKNKHGNEQFLISRQVCPTTIVHGAVEAPAEFHFAASIRDHIREPVRIFDDN